MADDKQAELQIEQAGSPKKLIIIIVALALLAAAAGSYFFFAAANEATPAPAQVASKGGAESALGSPSAQLGSALYVAMPRPFVFNVPGAARDRIVQIKVQLLVRGDDNEETAKKHIPLIEGTLLSVFAGTNADELSTAAGKESLRDEALVNVQQALEGVAGTSVVERVLFTGFVMQ
ncbi:MULTISPECIES: flagellar basal body-associated protein FliL [unclassified Pseudoalteromonas]|uniref:flagellar basal body-associated protein FliL n=1 Tax=unclassified Pseudoalteromonas TaxID=194690 RepID=UPI000CF73F70|nr:MULTISPECIES: flagellar basal body-associated protein FliL [unclassified Pseudoalteromonas]MBS3798814.1 flagellar basal body-associated protein FliL [Pseudoalteromonas sp. BDTF-M6]